MDNNKLQSKTIDWLRFPLVICVVFIHSFGRPETADMQQINYSGLTGMDIYNIIRVCGSHVATHICNSCFFMFSGFLFFYNLEKWNKNIYLKKIRRKIRTLLIPYIVWNLINVLIRPIIIIGGRIVKKDGDWGRFSLFFNEIMDKGIWNIFWHFNTWGNRTNILGLATPNFGPYSVPMWFLQSLIVLSISTPILYVICKKLRHYGIILLGILYYTGIWFSIPGFGIGPLFFFSIGAYYSIHKKNMVIELRRYTTVCYIIAIITLILCVYYDGIKMQDYFYPIYVLTGVVSAVNTASYLIERHKLEPNELLVKSTFFIYAMHTVLVLGIAGRIFDNIIRSKEPVILIIRYFSVPVTAIAICVLMYYVMEKTMPRILKILSGNR
jgi:peptidoglycan/LPS O-acetylase OafA/YrhL